MAEEIRISKEGRGEVLELQGTLRLFGFPPKEATLEALSRGLVWRGFRAFVFIGGGLLLAPLVGLVPPHAPWIVGSLGLGGFLGIRKWRERFTLLGFQGMCPGCGQPLHLKPGSPLRSRMSAPCEGCHHDSRLLVELGSWAPASRSDSGILTGVDTPVEDGNGGGAR